MKLSAILALSAVCAPFVAHAQTDDMSDVAAPIAPIPLAPKTAATSDAWVWRFAPPVGSRWTMRSFARTITTAPQGSPNNPRPYRKTLVQRFVADYDVLSRDALGATTIRLTYRELGGYEAFTSAADIFRQTGSSRDSRAKLIDGATLTLKQGPDGSVWNIVGARAFMRRVLGNSGVDDEGYMRYILDSMDVASNAGLKKAMNQQQNAYPAFSIRVGESWDFSANFPNELPGIASVEATGKRTLKALDAKFASIAQSARFDGAAPGQEAPFVDGTDVDFSQLTGIVTGNERIERASGLSVESNVNSTLKGRVITRIRATKTLQDNPVNLDFSRRVVLEPRWD